MSRPPVAVKPKPAIKRLWLRRCRICFRWCRIAVWFVLLAAICLAIYVSEVGLPSFVRDRITRAAEGQGVRLGFGAMRLHWLQGVTVDRARFEADGFPGEFRAEQIVLDLDQGALLSGKFKLQSLFLRAADLTLTPGDAGLDPIAVHDLTCRVSFPATNVVILDHLEGKWRTGLLSLQLAVTNPAAMRRGGDRPPATAGETRRSLTNHVERVARMLAKLDLRGVPSLRINMAGDAAHPLGITAMFALTVPEAATPWGNVTRLALEIRSGDSARAGAEEDAILDLRAGVADTPWGRAENIDAHIDLASRDATGREWSARFRAAMDSPSTPWVQAGRVEAEGETDYRIGDVWPARFDVDLRATRISSAHAAAELANIRVLRTPETNAWSQSLEPGELGPWTNLLPHRLAVEVDASRVKAAGFDLISLSTGLEWTGPRLRVPRFDAALPSGRLVAKADLDVATRIALGELTSNFDLASTRPVLTESGRRWMDQFTWTAPPSIHAEARLQLPAWTTTDVSWRDDLQPGLMIAGDFDVPGLAVQGVAFDRATGRFSHTNLVWRVQNGRFSRPEGGVDLELTSREQGAKQSVRLLSTIRPEALAPLLGDDAEKVFGMVRFPVPPLIEGVAEIDKQEPERSTFRGRLATTNVHVREVDTGHVSAGLDLAWPWVRFEDVRIERGTQWLAAPLLLFNLEDHMLSISNGIGQADVEPVARIIGPKTWGMLSAYEFLAPPRVVINGITPVHEEDRPKANLHFQIEGERFRWKYFNIGRLSGSARWTGNGLLLTNLAALAYDGTVGGSAEFDFRDDGEADFRFRANVDDVDLKTVLNDLGVTNRVEGRLSGNLTITDGSTHRPTGWNGFGQASLTNGFLWDYPLFAFLSPVVNVLAPGAGRDAARSAQGTYAITNNVIFSDNLEIRAAALRLNYRGSVGFDHRLNARVEATLLRDTWIVGPLLSFALSPFSKVFEYRVSGTLSEPVMEPVYVPGFLMKLMAPFSSSAPKTPSTPPVEPSSGPNPGVDAPAPRP